MAFTSLVVRFLEAVVKTDTGCWLWMGVANERGYGRMLITEEPRAKDGSRRSMHPAHHVMWREVTGAWPALGHELHHTCGAPACVNPRHLRLMPKAKHQRAHGRLRPTCPKCRRPYTVSRDGTRRRCMQCRKKTQRAWLDSPRGKAYHREYYRHYYHFQRYGTPMPDHIEIPPPS